MVHTVQERAFDVVSSILSGAIALARAQKQLGAFDIFRDLLTEVLRTSVRLVKAWPPEDSPRIQHRNALLDLLLAGNLTDQRRKVRLRHLLTGDSASASIEWHVGPGSAPDIAMWAKEVAELLAPYPTPILQRHRWVNSCPSLDWVALLANTHQLLKRVVPQWVGSLQNGKPGDLSDDSGDEAIAERDMPRAPDGQPDWKSWNEHQRSDAGKLAKGPYDGAMVVARITMQCQIRLLHALEERASHTWMNRVLQGWMGIGPPDKMPDCGGSNTASDKTILSVFAQPHVSGRPMAGLGGTSAHAARDKSRLRFTCPGRMRSILADPSAIQGFPTQALRIARCRWCPQVEAYQRHPGRKAVPAGFLFVKLPAALPEPVGQR